MNDEYIHDGSNWCMQFSGSLLSCVWIIQNDAGFLLPILGMTSKPQRSAFLIPVGGLLFMLDVAYLVAMLCLAYFLLLSLSFVYLVIFCGHYR